MGYKPAYHNLWRVYLYRVIIMSDLRDYIKFYGIWLDDWTTLWGGDTYSRHLLRTWTVNAESEPSSVWVQGGYNFLYPHHIKKKYFLEGVVEGEITFGATAHSHVSNYKVTIYKQNVDTTKTDLVSTNVITVANHAIAALGATSFHFWIDAYNAKELTEYDRLGVRVEWNLNGIGTTTANLYHDYDATYGYDLWVDVPLILGD